MGPDGESPSRGSFLGDDACRGAAEFTRMLRVAGSGEEQAPEPLLAPRRSLLGAAPRKRLLFGVAGLLLACLLGFATWAAGPRRGAVGVAAARVRNTVAKAAELACAKDYQDNCVNRTCCNEFTTCYEKQPGFGKCRPTCALGAAEEAPPWDPEADLVPWTCKVLGKKQEPPSWKIDPDASPSLYCFAVTLVRGSEPELLRRQLATGSGVFGCNKYSLFSERKMLLGPGPSGDVVATVPIGGPMATSRNNTWDFMRAWKQVIKQDLYRHHHWTVKLDPDSMFLAHRLRPLLDKHNINVDSEKVYFRNCQKWKSIQGPLEILSRAAAGAFFGSLEECRRRHDIMPHGEDWFIGHCMDALEFKDLEDWELLDDQYCAGLSSRAPCKQGKAAYHPFKTVESYMKCLEDTA